MGMGLNLQDTTTLRPIYLFAMRVLIQLFTVLLETILSRELLGFSTKQFWGLPQNTLRLSP